jgi:eukaryotic-like serine/threonine-protein kinase
MGTVLAGRYRIDGVLGTGGMGRVYRAEHVAMGKPVAVKVLHAALGKNQEAAVRFQREALASGRLDHPNIVGVIDFGTLENGSLYLVMEVLTGEHLGQRLDRDKRIPWAESLAIIRSVLSGLKHAHESGVVHRDIKPENIFLATKHGESVVKILDFGIAKLQSGVTDDQQATRAGITVGTPKYLSPEQAVGGAITPAADLYSTSVLLYEMLVGRAPFESEDPLTLLTSHAAGEVPPFHELAPDLEVPETVEALVRHGLGKLVSERIESAVDYMRQIDEILHAHGIDARTTPARGSAAILEGAARGTPVGTPTPVSLRVATAPTLAAPVPASTAAPVRPQQPAKRERWRALVAVAIAVAITGMLAFHYRRDDRAPRAQQVASAPLADAERAVKPADAKPAANPADARQTPAVHEHDKQVPRPAVHEHDKQLAADLRELQSGATCTQRKKAIAKLVALHDRSAVPALEKARARGRANACLRTAASQAIKTLGSK